MRKIILIIATVVLTISAIVATKPKETNACSTQAVSCKTDQPQMWQPPLPTLAPLPSWNEKPAPLQKHPAATPAPKAEKKYPPLQEVMTCKRAAQILVEVRIPHRDAYGRWIFHQIEKLDKSQKRALAKLLSARCGCKWTIGSTLVCPKELEIFDN